MRQNYKLEYISSVEESMSSQSDSDDEDDSVKLGSIVRFVNTIFLFK